jgi:Xaa-Pro aminopeptidase
MVLFDAGPCYKGYFTDLMRQGCVGQPSDVLRELFDTSVVGYQKGIELMRPGVKISELARQSIAAMKKYNPRIEYPLGIVGHCLGLALHEPPWFSPDEESVLETGMVVNFELGAYDIPQWRTLGGFLEDMFIITEDGNENLTQEGTMTLWVAD